MWQYQAAHGTSILTIATSASFEFGDYNLACGEWETPSAEFPSEPYYSYDSRTPLSTDLEAKYPSWKHRFCPTTAQFLAWFLGKPVDSLNGTVDIEALDTGRKHPLTIRVQEDGATIPDNAQAVDAHCVGLVMTMEKDRSFIVETEFVFGSLEDIDDNVNLTTAPVAPGDLLTGKYDGNPILIWDSAVDAHAISGVWKVQVMGTQEFEIVSSDEGTTQSVYTHKFAKPKIILYAVFATVADFQLWKDYKARKVDTDMTVQIKKADATSNILFTFSKCRINTIKKTGHRNAGHYGVIITLEADSVIGSSDWWTEGGITFATHWKANLA